ncbi:hypothetical protein [Borrelia miyamotoi]|uniref:hypothetical protein n=1 Tax=Borrelia miyamotoi TaxID=47466 RepID=UPI0022B49DEC|nr:hypothetical protein [Borrelia miyamotoi]WAZ92657.1 hypothetical protein O5402_04330 [Borrelia miyamotoi]WAZ93112.1 hypothetical protein O5402_06790 [Borrelia miyamotoi]
MEIKIKQIDTDEYLCETIQGALMNNILDIFYQDYKEILLSKLEKRAIKKPEAEVKTLQSEEQLRSEEVLQEQSQVKRVVKVVKKVKQTIT